MIKKVRIIYLKVFSIMFSFLIKDKYTLADIIIIIPHITDIITLLLIPDINSIGTKKLIAIINLAITTDTAVLKGASDLSLVFSAFLDKYNPKASDSVSEIAIAKIPVTIANLDIVPDLRPIINPKVVIVPDIIPKYIPCK